jgi:hypothetical protein
MPTTEQEQDKKHPVFRVHRIGAVVVALVLWVFAALGFASGTGFVTTQGAHALGMTGNGLLSTISVVVGVALVVAAARGGPVASTACAVIGGLFVLSGLLNLIVLNGPHNFLAFTMPNIIFSLVVGLILLTIGLYGRGSGQLPADNPYRRARGGSNPMSRIWHDEDLAQDSDVDPEYAEQRLAEISDQARAEYAVAQGTASPEQEREVMADAVARAEERRKTAWRRAEENEGAEHEDAEYRDAQYRGAEYEGAEPESADHEKR